MSQQNQQPSQSTSQSNSELKPSTSICSYLNLEQDGINKVEELFKTNNVTENSLLNIINEGNDEFKSVNGRNMTYSEMRSLYG